MFDRNINHAPIYKHVDVKHTENRAPTDDSIRLLREMETKSLETIVNSTRVQNTHLDAVIHTMLDPLNSMKIYAAIFSLNGQKYRVDHKADMWEKEIDSMYKLRNLVAEEIANKIMIHTGNKHTAGLY